MHNEGQSIHLTNDASRMVEIIGIRINDAFHEPISGHQLNICD